jgi:hypothetical protein
MTTEANKAILRRFFEDACNQNKVTDLDEYIATEGNVARHTTHRLASFADGAAGKRLTYKDLVG